MIEPITTKLAGVTFGDCQDNIKEWGCIDTGTYAVVREHNNKYDPNAVKVSLYKMFTMGYLPRHIAAIMAPLMDTGRNFLAEFICRNEYKPFENIGLTVRIVETTIQQ
jgi:hypothetical protein